MHIDGSEEASPPGADAECIICYDKPVTYGLMDGCSHVLCVQCIRQWRHPNNRTDDAETTNISCPYCRVPSYFVTPSSQFFPKDHPRRTEIVAQYKASMARVPCRHFQNSPPNRRRCPFGRDCFYQHLNPDGTTHIFPENTNPRRWMRPRDLDDLSASLERLRRSIPEVFGTDAPQTEQQRRLVDLALDVGRTLNRFGFAQPEAFNPARLLFIHYDDEEQPNAAEEAGDDDSDGQPSHEISDAILATAREAWRQAPAYHSEGSENGGANGGTAAGEPHLTDPAPCPAEISIRVNIPPGNLRFTVESTLGLTPAGEGSSGTREDRWSTAGTVREDRGEVDTSTQPGRSLEGNASPRGEVLQPEGSAGFVGSSEAATPATPPTPPYHDPHPPFETDGRGRVVGSNSSQQLRSWSSPPVPPRKSGNNETNIVKDKESERATDSGVCSNSGSNGDVDRSGQVVEREGSATGAP